MKSEFDMIQMNQATDNAADGWVLICPVCHSGNLHHIQVEVFERDKDSSHGLHVVVTGSKTSVSHDNLQGNPSARRNGLKIYFQCEGCKGTIILSIAQHQGSSIINFR